MSNSSFHTECEVFAALCANVGTPIAKDALTRMRSGDWMGLVSMKIKPADYVCAKSYLGDAQVCSFFKKFQGFDLGLDLKADSRVKFKASEAQCYQTNERLSPLLHDLSHYGEVHERLLRAWRKKIRLVLGRAPLSSSLKGRFGPGSTFYNISDNITLAHKLSDNYSITRQASPFLHSWDMTAWSRYAACGLDAEQELMGPKQPWMFTQHQDRSFCSPDSDLYAIRDVQYVRGNRFTTVPKSATTLRGICVEPSVNSYYQLAIGEQISKRMAVGLGWDKSTCQGFHKALAQCGSLTQAIATIDLSNASDTICKVLPKLLLPRDWYALVVQARSSHTLLDGGWVRLEKFSSMGNGYTFELETLIFWTLALAVQELEPATEDPYTPGLTTSVFGDDIILPSSVALTFVAALKFFGFTPNVDKTFLDGPFRESCGGDYFAGLDVRPHYQKEVCDEPHRLIALANGLRRFDRRYSDLDGSTPNRNAWFRCLDAIPRQIRICRGPESLGDLVIHDDETHWKTRNRPRTRNSIHYIRVWRPVANRVIGWDQFRPGVTLAVALYGGSSGAPSSYATTPSPADSLRRSGVIPRIGGSYISGYRFGRVAYS